MSAAAAERSIGAWIVCVFEGQGAFSFAGFKEVLLGALAREGSSDTGGGVKPAWCLWAQVQVHFSKMETDAGAAQHDVSVMAGVAGSLCWHLFGEEASPVAYVGLCIHLQSWPPIAVSSFSVPVPNVVCAEASTRCRSTAVWFSIAVWFTSQHCQAPYTASAVWPSQAAAVPIVWAFLHLT